MGYAIDLYPHAPVDGDWDALVEEAEEDGDPDVELTPEQERRWEAVVTAVRAVVPDLEVGTGSERSVSQPGWPHVQVAMAGGDPGALWIEMGSGDVDTYQDEVGLLHRVVVAVEQATGWVAYDAEAAEPYDSASGGPYRDG